MMLFSRYYCYTSCISILKRVSPNKSAVIDKINARLLRLAASVIARSIARMINHSFSTRVDLGSRIWRFTSFDNATFRGVARS